MRQATRITYLFATPSRRQRVFRLIGVLVTAVLISALAACTSGDGGDNGHGNKGDAPGVSNPGRAGGLTFSYPVDGQQDVYTQTQIAFTFAGKVSKGANNLTLVANPGKPNQQAVATQVTQDSHQPGIFRLQLAGQGDSIERPALQPDTQYAVEATGNIGAGNTQYRKGDTLFAFTTRPASNSPSAKGFAIVGHRGDSDDPFPFTAFNTIRLTLSEPVNPATVIKGDTFTVTDSGGMQVPGRMVANGRHISFDPSQNLKAGETYTVSLAKGNGGDGVHSIFGDALSGDHSFKLNPVSVGNSVKQNVIIEPTSNNARSLPANSLNGGPANVVSLVSELVGRNMLPAQNDPQRRSLLTVLAGTTSGDRYNNTFPAIIPAGQQFNLTPLNLKLGGAITTPVQSGPLVARFIDAADVFITANSLRNVKTPTAVHLRFDVAIGSEIRANDQNQIVANGAINQTVMNVVAAGLAVPQENGDIKLTTLGSFPTAVNRNGQAITDFELELTLKAGSQDGIRNRPDGSQPFITAQFPSACLYTFGSQFSSFRGRTSFHPVPIEAAESDCAANSPTLTNMPGDLSTKPAGADDFLPSENPSITFSEPIDPNSLTRADGTHDPAHLQLSDSSGGPVPFTAYVEGNSVVLAPKDDLAPDTAYTMSVGAGVTDLAGNSIRSTEELHFRTAPYVEASPVVVVDGSAFNNIAQTAPFITVLQPGLPCALDPSSGDYLTGGDTAGYCVGDQRDSLAPSATFPVFSLPANESIHAQFTKPVKVDSIRLADGCLTGGDGSGDGASIAVERVNDSGACRGVVPGKLLTNPGQDTTRVLTFVPDQPWKKDQRYWLVICGTDHDQCGAGAGTITGRDDGNGVKYTNTNGNIVDAPYSGALNTNPLEGTGTQAAQGTGTPNDAANKIVLSQGFRQTAGGPDIVMPFDGAAATRNYSFIAQSLPVADSNGNGIFDAVPQQSEEKYGPVIPKDLQPQTERPIAANATYTKVTANLAKFPQNKAVYQSGAVPNSVEPLTTDCGGAAGIVGSTPAQCLPVTLSQGGLFELTAFTGTRLGATQTGRLLLRVASANSVSGGTVRKQRGYIVPRCRGTIGSGNDAESYDYSPCFALSLNLLVNGPDGLGDPRLNVTFEQQNLNLKLVGPVSFTRNGRLVLTLRNKNPLKLDHISNNIGDFFSDPIVVNVLAGDAHIQLVGPPIHGGQLGYD